MGATSWDYFVPYQPDMRQVLADLHEEVFAQGLYEFPHPQGPELFMDAFELEEPYRSELLRLHGFGAYLESMSPEELFNEMARVSHLDHAPDLKTLRLQQTMSDSGTHSILDIAPNALHPLPDDDCLALFGTTTPDRETIEDWQWSLERGEHELTSRNEGFYVTVFKGGIPDEIYIDGYSGD
jgi:hypothetical protein